MADPILLGSPLFASDGAADDFFGRSVAINSDATVMAVGANLWEGSGTNQGGVYIYDRSGSTWTQRGSVLTASDAATGDFFGTSVSLSDNGLILAVGAQSKNLTFSGQGCVYIYDWSGSAWVQRGSAITASDAITDDSFATSLCLSGDGDILAVGAQAWEGANNDQGGVYIYDWSGSAWTQRGSVLTASDSAAADLYGFSVALSDDGSVLAVGSLFWEGATTDQGAVYIYDWSGSAWVQRGSVLTASDAGTNDFYGIGCSLNGAGTLLAVGAYGWDGSFADQGAVYLYDWNGSAWVERSPVFTAGDAAADASFGASVAISNSTEYLVVGSFKKTLSSVAQGAIYTYSFGLVAGQGSITFTGFQPSIPTNASVTPTGESTITFGGLQPALPTNATVTPLLGSLFFLGNVPTVELLIPQVGTFTYAGLQIKTSAPEPIEINGYGFDTQADILIEYKPDIAVTGTGFNTEAEIYFGAIVTGTGFSTNADINFTANNEIFVTGTGFSSSLDAVITSDIGIQVTGRGFLSDAEIYFGANVTGYGFLSDLDASFTASDSIRITGTGFSSTLEAVFNVPTTINVTGYGFKTDVNDSIEVIGYGFSSDADISFIGSTEIAHLQAFVMNINTNQVSRYTNYPFNTIIAVSNRYYGVMSDGLYLLSGNNDNDVDVLVNGTIRTKDDDFGDMRDKNIPYAYVGSDDKDLTITPIVDSVIYPTYYTRFNGRRVKMGRGIKGRYWSLRIDNITNLHALELMPDVIQRKVK
jgi:FG-GAP repeat